MKPAVPVMKALRTVCPALFAATMRRQGGGVKAAQEGGGGGKSGLKILNENIRGSGSLQTIP